MCYDADSCDARWDGACRLCVCEHTLRIHPHQKPNHPLLTGSEYPQHDCNNSDASAPCFMSSKDYPDTCGKVGVCMVHEHVCMGTCVHGHVLMVCPHAHACVHACMRPGRKSKLWRAAGRGEACVCACVSVIQTFNVTTSDANNDSHPNRLVFSTPLQKTAPCGMRTRYTLRRCVAQHSHARARARARARAHTSLPVTDPHMPTNSDTHTHACSLTNSPTCTRHTSPTARLTSMLATSA